MRMVRYIGFVKRMIGFKYKGQVAYITRIDDFRDYMEPEVYEAVQKAFENGCDGGLRQEYEELQSVYKELQLDYSKLENEAGDIDCVRDELNECERQRDSIQEKCDALTRHIESLVEQYYQRYIALEDILYELEQMT